jgi:hypothetical protein
MANDELGRDMPGREIQEAFAQIQSTLNLVLERLTVLTAREAAYAAVYARFATLDNHDLRLRRLERMK